MPTLVPFMSGAINMESSIDQFIAEITAFTKTIIDVDVCRDSSLECQKDYWKLDKVYLKEPLPFDFATSVCKGTSKVPKFIDQLIFTPRSPAEVLLRPLRGSFENSTQSKTAIFVAAAPSGVGKTYLAYQVGLVIPTIIIRVGTGSDHFSTPWNNFMKFLQTLDGGTSDEAEKAYRALKLVLWSYIYASKVVVSVAKSTRHSNSNEVLLRFHRNGLSEDIVGSIFDANIHFAEKDEDCNSFISSIHLDGNWLLCFDEVHLLLDKFPHLFFREGEYCGLKQGEQTDFRAQHGLFYGLTCVLYHIARNNNIRSYLTGTNFSISHLDRARSLLSVERYNLKKIELLSESFLTVENMIDIILHYWDFPRDKLDSQEIRLKQQPFVGRPLHFVDFVFRDIRLKDFVRASCSEWMSAFCEYLDQAKIFLQADIEDRLSVFFGDYRQLHPDPYCSATVAHLYPPLIKHVLCGDQHISMDDSAASVAIATRLLPSVTNTDVDLQALEPMSYETIRLWLLNKLRNPADFDQIYSLFLESLRGSQGSSVEEALSYYLALKTAAFGSSMSLKKLLRPRLLHACSRATQSFNSLLSQSDTSQSERKRAFERVCGSQYAYLW